jgi:hypothetical protein
LNDGEALPDIGAHEFAHPDNDSDGDGMKDRDEAVSGNSPLDPDDYFRVHWGREGGELILSWRTLPGRSYSLHANDQPGFPGDEQHQFAGTGGTIRHTNAASSSPHFFQLEVRE